MSDFFGTGASKYSRDAYIAAHELNKDETHTFTLGPVNSTDIFCDPKRLGFQIARYKFVSKMLKGLDSVLEVGCQEGLGTQLVAHEVSKVVAVDYYRPHIEACENGSISKIKNIEFFPHDIIQSRVDGAFDAAYALDVLEHIDPEQENLFMENIKASLIESGSLIIGIPSLESQAYASPLSKKSHINCKTGEDLRSFCKNHFKNVFMFGMNDEVLHTGFMPMSHYLFALCVGPK